MQRKEESALGKPPVLERHTLRSGQKETCKHPTVNEGTVMAHAASVAQEEVMKTVRNLRPWIRVCLTRMGAAFEVDFRVVPDGPTLSQSHALNSDKC